eukprot:scaffold1249_cov243-Pinguiococcus_pyrenoidosus.AAC.4
MVVVTVTSARSAFTSLVFARFSVSNFARISSCESAVFSELCVSLSVETESELTAAASVSRYATRRS